jgi:preprotein translocase subunit SecF
MEFFKRKTNFDFVGLFKFFGPVSGILCILAVVLIFKGMKYGVDFLGGAEIQVKFSTAVDIGEVRATLNSANFSDVSVQTIGEVAESNFLLKLASGDGDLNKISQDVQNLFQKQYQDRGVDIQKVDIVGPKAGKELKISAFLAMLWAIILIMIYVALRFDMRFAPGAIVALIHDALIVFLFYGATGKQFTLQTVGAILAVIGYSVNDTVVIYDRIRETEAKHPDNSLATNVNLAINETMSRTILTSCTVYFVCIAMLVFGGAAINDFFAAILVGAISGVYSTIYIAAPFTMYMEKILPKKSAKTVTA